MKKTNGISMRVSRLKKLSKIIKKIETRKCNVNEISALSGDTK